MSRSLSNGESFTASSIPKRWALPGFDGEKDFDGTSRISWYNEFAYASSTYDYPVFLTEVTFVGDEQIIIPAESKSYVGITGSGNQQTLVQTYVSAV